MANESFNAPPPRLDQPDSGAVARLEEGSGGKTPTVKEFPIGWIENLAGFDKPVPLTRQNSHNFDFIGMPIGGIGAGELYLGGDGRLWNWDIFNSRVEPGFPVEQGLAYVRPHKVANSADTGQVFLRQGFVLRTSSGGKVSSYTLDRDGFSNVQFSGEYPMGRVRYSSPNCPVSVELEAFSPFTPGAVEDSTYPATVLNYTLANTSGSAVTCELAGWLENGVAIKSRDHFDVELGNTVTADSAGLTLACSATESALRHPVQPPQVFDDFESGTYSKWTVEGTAFGTQPDIGTHVSGGKPPGGFQGKFLVNSFAAPDAKAKGELTSKTFVIQSNFISFLLNSGNYPGQECVNLVLDRKVVETATGFGGDKLRPVHWKVENLLGKTAQLQIVDRFPGSGKWTHIMVDQIVFSDTLDPTGPFATQPDVGTLALTLLGDNAQTKGAAQIASATPAQGALDFAPQSSATVPVIGWEDDLIGALKRTLVLEPGEKKTVSFLVTWYFPNSLPLSLKTTSVRQYSKRFTSATDVATNLAADLPRLTAATRLWHDTWYDSTLPAWFLSRTFANVSTLATGTTYLLGDGRFYGYEGQYSCPGTCTHVWGYQQGLGFLFPALERAVLEKVEFNRDLGMNAQGGVAMRAEFDKTVPVDGEAGIILRSYLVHRMSSDTEFLQKNYPAIKKVTDFLVKTYDVNQTGILRGEQHNTMDAAWQGEIAWLSLYYQSALLATAQMADLMNDGPYATSLRETAARGRDYIDRHLFNGEYYFQEADPEHENAPGVYIGCQSDQLLGQNWAFETGLGSTLDPGHLKTALNSIWKYNYTTDAGLYRKTFREGRTYALDHEGAVIMCTFPLGGEDALKKGRGSFAAYMNETWAGCEHALAATMMWEGLVDKALAIERSIDDRYSADKRNPWDECECGSHYSRSLDSYGVFIAACGFEYNGPAGFIAFSPRIHPENFKAAFTSAEGWGSFGQQIQDREMNAALTLRSGRLTIRQLALTDPRASTTTAICNVDGRPVSAASDFQANRALIDFSPPLDLHPGQTLTVRID
jgi:non-lysosomal glucosylceramidase